MILKNVCSSAWWTWCSTPKYPSSTISNKNTYFNFSQFSPRTRLTFVKCAIVPKFKLNQVLQTVFLCMSSIIDDNERDIPPTYKIMEEFHLPHSKICNLIFFVFFGAERFSMWCVVNLDWCAMWNKIDFHTKQHMVE